MTAKEDYEPVIQDPRCDTGRRYKMTQQPILEAKLKLAALRSEFEMQKEREWIDLQAGARTELENAVWAAKEAGRTVSDIAREYGTTDRHTIYNILKRRQGGSSR